MEPCSGLQVFLQDKFEIKFSGKIQVISRNYFGSSPLGEIGKPYTRRTSTYKEALFSLRRTVITLSRRVGEAHEFS